jgi:cob(I)alamin adenosyltransferase
MSPRLPFSSAVATGRGDDGTTGLLFDSTRVPKDDVRTEAFGTVDEAVAALGIARAEIGSKQSYGALSPNFGSLGDLILRLQRELFVVGAELATAPEARRKQVEGTTRVSAAMLEGLETVLRDTEASITLPREFVVPGETRISAALELARTVVRRAERRAVTLGSQDDIIASSLIIPYLNRLADLLWILARTAEQAESRTATTARVEARAKPVGTRASNPVQAAPPEGAHR